VFFLAAGVIAGALSASASASRRLVLGAQAADLAVSVLSEIHAGVLPAVSDGPNACGDPDRADWTWQVIVSSAESSPPEMPEKLVEVVVTEGASKFTYRLASLVPDPDAARQLDIGSEWEPYTEAP